MKTILCVLAIGSMVALTACDRSDRTITISGSDTMVNLGQRWAETYMHHNPGVTVQVTGGGSNAGIAALTNGATEICEASRPMEEKERADVRAKRQKDVKEIPVALDGLAVFLNESNPVQELSLAQLEGIYRGKITDWKDVGGRAGRIVCYGRENSSGTYIYFKEHVLKKKDFATEVQSLPGTAAVINAVSKDAAAIGYGGIGYLKGVKAIRVSAGEGKPGVEPTMQNVISGTYPISRYLYFYTAGEPEGQVKAFIDWVLGVEGQKVCEQVGYYPLPKK